MYRFVIKMISHSSTEHNVCTHTHPHGHARKCCQITLVHTHGHTRGATLVLTVQPGHAQAHLGTLYIRRAGSSSRAAAQRAHGAFKCSTHMRRKRRHESCIDSDGRRCRCCPQLPLPGGSSKHWYLRKCSALLGTSSNALVDLSATAKCTCERQPSTHESSDFRNPKAGGFGEGRART
jgi:hypothetical protein